MITPDPRTGKPLSRGVLAEWSMSLGFDAAYTGHHDRWGVGGFGGGPGSFPDGPPSVAAGVFLDIPLTLDGFSILNTPSDRLHPVQHPLHAS